MSAARFRRSLRAPPAQRMVRPSDDFGPVPRIIHQTWDTPEGVPPCCLAVMAETRRRNPGWEHRFHDAGARRGLVEQHFGGRTLAAFDKLPTPTAAADLFRLCCLHVHGGLYLDIKAGCGPLTRLDTRGRLLYMKWPYGLHPADHPEHAVTSVLMWPPGHWVLRDVIEEVVRRVLACTPTQIRRHITHVTGPNVYAAVVCARVPPGRLHWSDDYCGGLFEHDATGGAYYAHVKARGLHWQQQ